MLGTAIYKARDPEIGLLKFKAKGDVAYGSGYTDSRSYEIIAIPRFGLWYFAKYRAHRMPLPI